MRILILLCCIGSIAAVVVSNVDARRSQSGRIIDVHDGNTLRDGDQYLRFGASYGECVEPSGDTGCKDAKLGACGFKTNHNVSLYTTTNLVDWSEGEVVFQAAEAGLGDAIMFCPKVIQDPKTQEYVLWFNYILGGDFSRSFYAVAKSPSARGPFSLVNTNVTMGNEDIGDFALFLDEDGLAYVIYTSHLAGEEPTHRMSIERMSPGYAGSLGHEASSGFIGASFVEAPVMFKRGEIYYALFGTCCCYCEAGSAVVVYTSISPLGPWAQRNTLDPVSSFDSSDCKEKSALSRQTVLLGGERGSGSGSCFKKKTIHAQQTDVFMVETAKGIEYIWVGDRWQQAPDRIKAHDPTYLAPLHFEEDGNITSVKWVDSFEIDL